MIKRALISVFDKDGILELASFLENKGIEIISTGGTFKHLTENGIKCTSIESLTGFKEMMDGRVKTLNPYIHGGILCLRNNENHMNTVKEMGLKLIDLVVVNLYPFFYKVEENLTEEEKIEFIDIGGPTMLRSAAKNFKFVTALTDPKDYEEVMSEINNEGDTSFETRKNLAGKVFNLTSAYDAAISNFLLQDGDFHKYLSLSYELKEKLSYGENPHQKAAIYEKTVSDFSMKNFTKLNGKDLSYNNYKDMDIAWKVVSEFTECVCCAVKHNTPCGVAIGSSAYDAYVKAYSCDEVSIFGGIVAFNREVTKEAAEELYKTFLEVIIAPSFSEEALEILKKKKNLRIIMCKIKPSDKYDIQSVDGGLLVQERNTENTKELTVVTEKKPSKEELDQLLFAMKVVKYVKSNAIVVAKDFKAIGIGGGQVNRINAAKEALLNAKERMDSLNLESPSPLVMSSDAFFPFGDVASEAGKYGITSIIQPGGSIRDNLSIDECNKNGISMVFTGIRHFKH